MAADKKADMRGKKTCPKCGKVHGVRTLECSCGYKFTFKASKKTATNQPTQNDQFLTNVHDTLVLVGEVKDLIAYLGSDVETVLDKVEAMVQRTGSFASLKSLIATVKNPVKAEQAAPLPVATPPARKKGTNHKPEDAPAVTPPVAA